jgi:hypothetical protein
MTIQHGGVGDVRLDDKRAKKPRLLRVYGPPPPKKTNHESIKSDRIQEEKSGT